MKCPACDHENPEGQGLCSSCGAELAVETAERPADQPTISDMVTTPPESGDVDQPTISGPVTTPPESEPGPDDRPKGPRYRSLERLGQGGMGVVWKAEDHFFKPPRVVAIKRPRLPPGCEARLGLDRLIQEAGVMADLKHLNIVTVYDVGHDKEGRYIVMEYVEGRTLAEVIRERGKLPIEEALPLARGIMSALSYAHKKAVLHLDVKPANILVTPEGLPKVLDFGLARIRELGALSSSGSGGGTPLYVAPEMKRGAKGVDHRADIYSLGATLYQMLTGEPPSTISFDLLPPGLAKMIRKCMEASPEKRYFSVDELLADLEVVVGPMPARAEAPLAGKEGETAQCLNCRTFNSEKARFCKHCGAGLFAECVRCGKESKQGSAHCSHCGVNFAVAKDIHARLRRATLLMAQHKYTSAIQELDAALKLEPEHGEAATLREQAVRARESLIELKGRAQALLKSQERREAVPVLEEYLGRAPDDTEVAALLRSLKSELAGAEVSLARAKDLLQLKEYQGALAELDSLLALDPKQKEALGLREEAGRVCAKANGLRERARALLDAGEYQQAEGALRDLLGLVPGDPDARRMLDELPTRIVEQLVGRAESLARLLENEAAKETIVFRDAEELVRRLGPHAGPRKRLEDALRKARLAKRVGEIRALIRRGALDDAEARITEALRGEPKDPILAQLRREARVSRSRRHRKGFRRAAVLSGCVLSLLVLGVGMVVNQIDSRHLRRAWIFVEIGDRQKAVQEWERMIFPWLQGREYHDLKERLTMRV